MRIPALAINALLDAVNETLDEVEEKVDTLDHEENVIILKRYGNEEVYR